MTAITKTKLITDIHGDKGNPRPATLLGSVDDTVLRCIHSVDNITAARLSDNVYITSEDYSDQVDLQLVMDRIEVDYPELLAEAVQTHEDELVMHTETAAALLVLLPGNNIEAACITGSFAPDELLTDRTYSLADILPLDLVGGYVQYFGSEFSYENTTEAQADQAGRLDLLLHLEKGYPHHTTRQHIVDHIYHNHVTNVLYGINSVDRRRDVIVGLVAKLVHDLATNKFGA